jgi:hypothetical protein
MPNFRRVAPAIRTLRRALCAAALVTLLTGPAFAELGGKAPPGPPPAPGKSRQDIESERAAEQAYKSSLKNIPDKPPADPWGNARNMDAPKTAAKAAKAAPAKQVKTGTAN